MKSAHQRFGVLEYFKSSKDTTTRVRLRLDRFVGELQGKENGKAHLISVLGGDSDVGAVWAGVNEQGGFTIEGPGIQPVQMALGEVAQCFRGTVAIPGRKPIRQLVAVSADVAKARPGADPGGKRTVLCDDDPILSSTASSAFWLASVARVGKQVRRGAAPPPRYPTLAGSGVLAGVGDRHKKSVPQVDRERSEAQPPLPRVQRTNPLERYAQLLFRHK